MPGRGGIEPYPSRYLGPESLNIGYLDLLGHMSQGLKFLTRGLYRDHIGSLLKGYYQ